MKFKLIRITILNNSPEKIRDIVLPDIAGNVVKSLPEQFAPNHLQSWLIANDCLSAKLHTTVGTDARLGGEIFNNSMEMTLN